MHKSSDLGKVQLHSAPKVLNKDSPLNIELAGSLSPRTTGPSDSTKSTQFLGTRTVTTPPSPWPSNLNIEGLNIEDLKNMLFQLHSENEDLKKQNSDLQKQNKDLQIAMQVTKEKEESEFRERVCVVSPKLQQEFRSDILDFLKRHFFDVVYFHSYMVNIWDQRLAMIEFGSDIVSCRGNASARIQAILMHFILFHKYEIRKTIWNIVKNFDKYYNQSREEKIKLWGFNEQPPKEIFIAFEAEIVRLIMTCPNEQYIYYPLKYRMATNDCQEMFLKQSFEYLNLWTSEFIKNTLSIDPEQSIDYDDDRYLNIIKYLTTKWSYVRALYEYFESVTLHLESCSMDLRKQLKVAKKPLELAM